MTDKNRKKSIVKLKQIGSKSSSSKTKLLRSKDQDQSLRSKPETESSLKELSELEKELFTIKINDLEERVARKTQLCEFLGDEKAAFEVESRNLKLLKKESMGLLNKAYQEFCLELQLLDHELKGLEDGYSMSEKKEKEDIEATKRLNSLSSMETQLVERLEEAKRSVDEIDDLESKLRQLHHQINERKGHFNDEVRLLNSEFMDFIRKLENKLDTIVKNTIKNKELKLHLLPVPYQALFMSGQLGKTWCDSVLKCCEALLLQNAEIKMSLSALEIRSQKIYDDISKSLFSIVTSQQIRLLNCSPQKSGVSKSVQQEITEPSNVFLETEMHSKYIDHLNNLASQLEKEIGDLLRKLREVENTIIQHERSEYDTREDFHMMHIIMQAKDVIIKEL